MYIGQKNNFIVIYKPLLIFFACFVSINTAYADCTKVDTTLEAIKCLEERITQLSNASSSAKVSLEKEILSLDKDVTKLNGQVTSNNDALSKNISVIGTKVNKNNSTQSKKISTQGKKISSLTSKVNSRKVAVVNCKVIKGSCGTGMFNRPTYYFDRVNYSCPSSRPVLKQFKFARCGAINTANEGLVIYATCCGLALK